MAKKIKVIDQDILELSQSMIDRDNDRNDLFRDIDKAVHGEWDFPATVTPQLKSELYKVVTSDPQDAVRGIQREIAAMKVVFRVEQMAPDPENRLVADEIETALMSGFNRASLRMPSGFLHTAGWEAAKYAMVGVRVTDIEHEKKSFNAMGIDKKLPLNAVRFGRFAYEVYPAPNIHARRSSWGLEAVLLVQEKTLRAIKSEWGTLASGIEDHFDNKDPMLTVYDYEEEGKRWVWVSDESGGASNQFQTGNSVTGDNIRTQVTGGQFVIMNGEKTDLENN